MQYISPPNAKTGSYSFDLPADITCPGATATCISKCYALKLAKAYPSAGRKYERNKRFSQMPQFADYMIKHIPYSCTFRIHVSGDFTSNAYIKKWCRIISRRSDVKFYAYTRSWRQPQWSWLQHLAGYKNMTLNLSCDKETGKPPREDYRWCYLSTDDTAPNWLRDGDIIFRTNHNGQPGNQQWARKRAINNGQDPDIIAPLIHKIGAAKVCPLERGRKLPDQFDCLKCQLCIKNPSSNKD